MIEWSLLGSGSDALRTTYLQACTDGAGRTQEGCGVQLSLSFQGNRLTCAQARVWIPYLVKYRLLVVARRLCTAR